MARIIGIVPARSGSERLPGKNMRPLAGHPLLAWTLAVATRTCDVTIVTSDDIDILQFAARFPQTNCIARDRLLSHARVPDYPVVVDAYEKGCPNHLADDVIVLLRPTAPFRTAAEIRGVVELLGMTADSVRSVVPSRERPDKSYREVGYAQAAYNGPRLPILEPWAGKWHKANHPSQTLPKSWRACGFIDAVRADVIRGGHMEGDSIIGWQVPEPRGGFDIDTLEDFQRAEALAIAHGWTPGNVTP